MRSLFTSISKSAPKGMGPIYRLAAYTYYLHDIFKGKPFDLSVGKYKQIMECDESTVCRLVKTLIALGVIVCHNKRFSPGKQGRTFRFIGHDKMIPFADQPMNSSAVIKPLVEEHRIGRVPFFVEGQQVGEDGKGDILMTHKTIFAGKTTGWKVAEIINKQFTAFTIGVIFLASSSSP